MKKIKTKVTIIALLLSLIVVGGTIAYLLDSTDSITNTFVPVDIDSHVQDDYRIQNVSNDLAGFVRAYVTVNYVDSDGGYHFVEDTSGYVTLGTDWVLGADGYFYYTKLVEPKEYTSAVVTVNPVENSDYTVKVEIVSDIIQGDPTTVVTSIWDSATSVSSDGKTLTVATE